LYDRVATVLGHVEDTGSRLKSAVDAYNKLVGSLEGRVLVTLRRFREIGVATQDVDEPRVIESTPRAVAAPELAGPER
jgi:DNA recombination protein RmuC